MEIFCFVLGLIVLGFDEELWGGYVGSNIGGIMGTFVESKTACHWSQDENVCKGGSRTVLEVTNSVMFV